MTQLVLKLFESIGKLTVSIFKLSAVVFLVVGIAAVLTRVGMWSWALVMGF